MLQIHIVDVPYSLETEMHTLQRRHLLRLKQSRYRPNKRDKDAKYGHRH